jgi:uncharacterized membrane protein
VHGRSLPAFQLCGYLGLSVAIALEMTLAMYLDLFPWTMMAIIFAAMLTFFASAMATKIITGIEEKSQDVAYHGLKNLAARA